MPKSPSRIMIRLPIFILATTLITQHLATDPRLVTRQTEKSILRRIDDLDLMEGGYLPPLPPIRVPARPTGFITSISPEYDDSPGPSSWTQRAALRQERLRQQQQEQRRLQGSPLARGTNSSSSGHDLEDPLTLQETGPSRESLQLEQQEQRLFQPVATPDWLSSSSSEPGEHGLPEPWSPRRAATLRQFLQEQQQQQWQWQQQDRQRQQRQRHPSHFISPPPPQMMSFETDLSPAPPSTPVIAQDHRMYGSNQTSPAAAIGTGTSSQNGCLQCVRSCVGVSLNATDRVSDNCAGCCGRGTWEASVTILGCCGVAGTLVGVGILFDQLS